MLSDPGGIKALRYKRSTLCSSVTVCSHGRGPEPAAYNLPSLQEFLPSRSLSRARKIVADSALSVGTNGLVPNSSGWMLQPIGTERAAVCMWTHQQSLYIHFNNMLVCLLYFIGSFPIFCFQVMCFTVTLCLTFWQ